MKTKKELELWKRAYLDHELNIDKKFHDHVEFLYGMANHLYSVNGNLMYFIRPIYIEDGFRLCPLFPQYTVSEQGEIKDLRTNEYIQPALNKALGYLTAWIYDPRINRGREIAIHRLIGGAWVDRTDILNKTIINHIDGNKLNLSVINLEWTTYSENSIHAFKHGLRSDNIRCKLRDIHTGEVKEFFSLGEMARHIGIGRAIDPTKFRYGTTEILLHNKYEVRCEGDDRPWFYSDTNTPIPKSRYKTTVIYPDGKSEVYWDNRDIIKKFKCWNVSSGIESIIEKARSLYPDLIFNVEDRWKDRIVQCINIETNEITESQWVRDAAKKMGIGRNSVTRLLLLGQQRVINGYAVRYKTDVPWNLLPEEYEGQSVWVRVTNVDSGESKIYSSLREIERELDVSRFVTKSRLDSGKLYQNLKFEKITNG